MSRKNTSKKKPPRTPRWRRWAIRAGIAVGAFYLGLFALAGCADTLINHPPRPATYGESMPGFFRIPLPGGGDVAALWIPHPGATTAILCFHGNGVDLGQMRPHLAAMAQRTGCAVLMVDYPGYGLSAGSPTETGTLRSAEVAYENLTRVRGFAPESVVVRGLSLGSGPAVWIAAHRRVKALILDAPFTSTFRVVTHVKLLPVDQFDNLAIADRVQCPVLVVHGDRDTVVPFSHGKELAAAMTNAESVRFLKLPGAGHEITIGDDRDPEERAEVAKIVAGASRLR